MESWDKLKKGWLRKYGAQYPWIKDETPERVHNPVREYIHGIAGALHAVAHIGEGMLTDLENSLGMQSPARDHGLLGIRACS